MLKTEVDLEEGDKKAQVVTNALLATGDKIPEKIEDAVPNNAGTYRFMQEVSKRDPHLFAHWKRGMMGTFA